MNERCDPDDQPSGESAAADDEYAENHSHYSLSRGRVNMLKHELSISVNAPTDDLHRMQPIPGIANKIIE
jgi:hypothetical protein